MKSNKLSKLYLIVPLCIFFLSCSNNLNDEEMKVISKFLTESEWYDYDIKDRNNYIGNTLFNELRFKEINGSIRYDWKSGYNSEFTGEYLDENVKIYYDDEAYKGDIVVDLYRGDKVFKNLVITVNRDSLVEKLNKQIEYRRITEEYYKDKKFTQIFGLYRGQKYEDTQPNGGLRLFNNMDMKGIFENMEFNSQNLDLYYYNTREDIYPDNVKIDDIIHLRYGSGEFKEKYTEENKEFSISKMNFSSGDNMRNYFSYKYELYETNIFDLDGKPYQCEFVLKSKDPFGKWEYGLSAFESIASGSYSEITSKSELFDSLFKKIDGDIIGGTGYIKEFYEDKRRITYQNGVINFQGLDIYDNEKTYNSFLVYFLQDNPNLLFFTKNGGDENKYFILKRI